jgi:hypothetical protein
LLNWLLSYCDCITTPTGSFSVSGPLFSVWLMEESFCVGCPIKWLSQLLE